MDDGNIAKMAAREKYWKECSIEEKIARTRQQVNNLISLFRDFELRLAALERHAHLNDQIVFNPDPYNRITAGKVRRNDDEVYF